MAMQYYKFTFTMKADKGVRAKVFIVDTDIQKAVDRILEHEQAPFRAIKEIKITPVKFKDNEHRD
jgi:hypothetical protein